MPTIQANDINIEYEISGSGQPLVLISGLGYDRWMWHRMVPGLAAHFRVVTFDNRGVGGSDAPKGPYTADLLAADTAALIEGLGLENAAVMGHSMGGFIAQALALDFPHLVSKLILSATNYGGPNHLRITQEALLVLMDSRGDPIERLKRGILVSTAPGFAEREPAFLEEWIAFRAAHPIDPAAYEAQLAIGLGLMAEAACFENKLSQIEVETLILFGEIDKVVPPGNAALLAQKLSKYQIEILPGAGHFFPFEAPDAAVTAVTQFLQQ